MAYFTLFDSYVQATGDAKGFVVTVELIAGGDVVSSPIPIADLEAVKAEIQEGLETQMPVTIWDRVNKTITTVPNANIKRVVYQLT